MRIEDYPTLFPRAQNMISFMREYLRFNNVKENQKLAIVAHSSYLKSITAKGLNEKDELIDGKDMKNCQITPM